MRRFRLSLTVLVVMLCGSTALGGPSRTRAQEATPAGTTARTDVRYLLPFGPDGLNPGLHRHHNRGGRLRLPLLGGAGSPRCLGLHRRGGPDLRPLLREPVHLAGRPRSGRLPGLALHH